MFTLASEAVATLVIEHLDIFEQVKAWLGACRSVCCLDEISLHRVNLNAEGVLHSNVHRKQFIKLFHSSLHNAHANICTTAAAAY